MKARALTLELLPPTVALLLALLAGSVVILAFGEAPGSVYRLLVEGTWGQTYGLGQVLYKATTLTFTGLAVAVGLRAGLFNIGGEGQLAAGGFGAALVGLWLPPETSFLLAAPACLLAAMAFGAVAAAIPGALKALFGAHEVIVTILLNFIILALLNYLLGEHLRVQETTHTAPVVAGATLPRFASLFPGSAVNAVAFVALGAAALVYALLFRTRFGYELRAVGLSPTAARYGGVSIAGIYVGAMALSGALAGLGGVNFVLGYKHYYEDGFSGGAGFFGIAVALVGRNHPVGILFAALLFATLSQGGLAIHALVPKQLVEVLEAVVIGVMAAAVPAVRYVALRSASAATAPSRAAKSTAGGE